MTPTRSNGGVYKPTIHGIVRVSLCFLALLSALVLARESSTGGHHHDCPSNEAVEIHVVVGSTNVTVTAFWDENVSWVAQEFCERYSLLASEDGQACLLAVENELLLAYHEQEEAASTLLHARPLPFSHIRQQDLPLRLRYRRGHDNLTHAIDTVHQFYQVTGLDETTLEAHHSHGMYIPLIRRPPHESTLLGADVSLREGEIVHMDYLAHHPPISVAQQLCLTLGSRCQDCPLESLVSQLEAHALSPLATVQAAPLLLSLDLDLEWSPGKLRRFVVYQNDDVQRRAASFCAVHRCPDRVNQVTQLVQMVYAYRQAEPPPSSSLDFVPVPPASHNRVVVSLSTLPSRIHHVPARIRELISQTHPPDHIYLVLPDWSMREKAGYHFETTELDKDKVTILHTSIDWGPATKLIPVLQVETDPRTAIITVDDDIQYPATLVQELVQNSRRLPNAALGFKGFRLPSMAPYRHDRLQYVESCNETSDVLVDVLGGVTGVLYRSAFFDYDRLTDYLHHPLSSGFYVDDEWIAAALAEGGIPRVVLSRNNAPSTSCRLFEDRRVLPYHKDSSLNGPNQAPRNMAYQHMILDYFVRQQVFHVNRSRTSFVQEVYDPEYYPLMGRRADSLRKVLLWMESLRQGNDDYYYVIVETGTVGQEDASQWRSSGQSTIIYDRFINFYDGVLYTVDLDKGACQVARKLTSNRTQVIHSDSVNFLWSLRPEKAVDLVYLDSYDIEDWVTPGAKDEMMSAIHHLKELAAILPKTNAQSSPPSTSSKTRGTMIVVDDNEVGTDGKVLRGKGRLVQEILSQGGGCQEVLRGWQMGWLCGGEEVVEEEDDVRRGG